MIIIVQMYFLIKKVKMKMKIQIINNKSQIFINFYHVSTTILFKIQNVIINQRVKNYKIKWNEKACLDLNTVVHDSYGPSLY